MTLEEHLKESPLKIHETTRILQKNMILKGSL